MPLSGECARPARGTQKEYAFRFHREALMAAPREIAEAVRQYQTHFPADMPTLGVLRIDTESGPHLLLLTRKTAALLRDVAAEMAERIAPLT